MTPISVWYVQGAIKVAVAVLTAWQTSHSQIGTVIVGLTALSAFLSQAPPADPVVPASTPAPDTQQDPPAVSRPSDTAPAPSSSAGAAVVSPVQHLAEAVEQTEAGNA